MCLMGGTLTLGELQTNTFAFLILGRSTYDVNVISDIYFGFVACIYVYLVHIYLSP